MPTVRARLHQGRFVGTYSYYGSTPFTSRFFTPARGSSLTGTPLDASSLPRSHSPRSRGLRCTKGSPQLHLAGHLRGQALTEADAFRRSALLSEWSLSGKDVTSSNTGLDSVKIITQNVRGFTKQGRTQWMKAWRGRPLRERPLAWCLQETHVSGVDQAKAHSLQWAQLWSKHTYPSHPPLSYWSTGSSQAGGVAILLNPKSALDALVW